MFKVAEAKHRGKAMGHTLVGPLRVYQRKHRWLCPRVRPVRAGEEEDKKINGKNLIGSLRTSNS